MRHEFEQDGERKLWRYQLLECTDCGLGMLDPEPTLELLQTFYAADYGHHQAVQVDPARVARSLKYRVARARFAPGAPLARSTARAFELLSGKTVSYSLAVPLALPKTAAIFELGFGDGSWLLSMAAQGYSALSGYDIAANHAQLEQLRQRGIRVSSGDFLRNDYPSGAYDCIRMEHVFEHLIAPVQVLERCRAMLKPGGRLVITSPCLDSWSTRVSLLHSPNGHEIPRHVYHHTARSAQAMLRTAGFRTVECKVYGDAASLAATVNGARVEAGKRSLPRALFVGANPLYRGFCAATGKGELLTISAQ